MANATQTLAGDIQLAGDLAGGNNAAFPTLVNTGVTPGTYNFPDLTIDAKGRITAAVNGTPTFNLQGDVTGDNLHTVLTSTGVTPGTYTVANITVDAKGRITAASNGSFSGDVTIVGGSTTLPATGVTAGSYSLANITVDAKGRITSASGNTIGGDISGASLSSVSLAATGVTAGTYTNANITVDAKGRITAAVSGGPGGVAVATYVSLGTVQIAQNTGLTITSGSLSGTPATNTTLGVVRSANTANISISNGNIDVGSNIPKLDTRNTFQKSVNTTPVALTSGSTIAVDASLSNVFTLTIGTNATLSNPTNLGAGSYTFVITQDATGGRTLGFGSAYKFTSGASTAIESTANSVSIVICTSDGTNLYCTIAKNFV